MINHLLKYRLAGFLVLIMTAMFVIIYPGCKDSGTNPPVEKPEGYQEDIPWPSLADSPWPMYGSDPQQTNRSKFENNLAGLITQSLKDYNIETSLSIGDDASIYFTTTDKKLFHLDSSGGQLWEFPLNTNAEGGEYAPVILKDGSVLAADITYLYKIDKNGALVWRYAYNFPKIPLINIGRDGTIYLIADFTTLLAVSEEGEFLWLLKDETESWNGRSAISPDGTTIYLKGKALNAVDLNEHKIKWKTQFQTTAPLIDSKGYIFCIRPLGLDSLELLSLDKEGKILWTYQFNDQASVLTMDKKGNIYFGDDNVYSVDYTGKQNWKIEHANFYQPVICDNRNNIYIIRPVSDGFSVKCISENGIMLWEKTKINVQYTPSYGGAIGYNRLFLPGWGVSPVYIIH